ncbi:MAG: acyl-CoA synthetase [Ilumatobacter sp.]|uniref:acyl-CoA synthetase n=1 Tax=Ilumatobacter sp. TaxID=1967498 RepID=UPI0026064656|nr:acyl-CoA synthetase [Ilumatobacter sp.]MDJ0767795.1 acyl-CoA synthetase [Ilumatobacter sp.]
MTGLLPALHGSHPDAPDAVVVDGESATWERLAGRADALVARIAGAPAIAVHGAPSLDTVIAVVAGIRAGVPVVPVAADAGPMERDHVLADSGATLVIGDPDWPEVTLDRIPVPIRPAGVSAEVASEAPALIMYTSGTTGLPKGAVIPRRAIAAGLDGLADAWGWTPDDRLVHGLPLFHVHGLILGVLGALRVGSRLVHTGRSTPERYAAAGGTLYFGVPTVWSRLTAALDHARSLASARLLVSGSAALPVPVFESLRSLTGQAPVERYGMTETLITLSTRHDGERRPGHVGVPIAGVETRLRDDRGDPVPHDGETIGGLEVRGATLFDGYLHQPEKTAESFTDDGWFVTGDAATIGDDGFHRIAGRASIDIIKSGGYKVGAAEVESALLSHPAVAEAAVVGQPDDDLGERIVAYVVADGVDADALIDHVAGSLSVHKRPREIRHVAALPRNALGKVQKTKLGGGRAPADQEG